MVCLLAAGTTRAKEGDYWIDGHQAYERGDYPKAFRLFQSAAAKGDGHAMNYLGEMYASGRGVERDHDLAVKWFRAAADRGNANAMNNLGEMFAGGWGVPQSYSTATEWFQKASDRGDARGRFNLGKMYAAGLGVMGDLKIAGDLLRKALKGDPKNWKIRNWLGAVPASGIEPPSLPWQGNRASCMGMHGDAPSEEAGKYLEAAADILQNRVAFGERRERLIPHSPPSRGLAPKEVRIIR